MNPEIPPPNPRANLEAQVTAYLLGELSAHEAAALRSKLDEDAQLAQLIDRLRPTVSLVREAAVRPSPQDAAQPAAPLQLSADRREKLLAQFKTITPKEFAPKPVKRWTPLRIAVDIAAALVLLGLIAAVVMPKFAGVSRRAMIVARENEGRSRQKELGLEMSAVDEITMVDGTTRAPVPPPGNVRQQSAIRSRVPPGGTPGATPPAINGNRGLGFNWQLGGYELRSNGSAGPVVAGGTPAVAPPAINANRGVGLNWQSGATNRTYGYDDPGPFVPNAVAAGSGGKNLSVQATLPRPRTVIVLPNDSKTGTGTLVADSLEYNKPPLGLGQSPEIPSAADHPWAISGTLRGFYDDNYPTNKPAQTSDSLARGNMRADVDEYKTTYVNKGEIVPNRANINFAGGQTATAGVALPADVSRLAAATSDRSLTPSERDAFKAQLAEKGYGIIQDGPTSAVIPLLEAKKNGILVAKGTIPDDVPNSADMRTQIIPLNTLNAVELVKGLQPHMSPEATYTVDEGANAIVMTDTSANIRRSMEIISALDKTNSAGSTVSTRPVGGGVGSLKIGSAAVSAAGGGDNPFKALLGESGEPSANGDLPGIGGSGRRGGGGGAGGGGRGDVQARARSLLRSNGVDLTSNNAANAGKVIVWNDRIGTALAPSAAPASVLALTTSGGDIAAPRNLAQQNAGNAGGLLDAAKQDQQRNDYKAAEDRVNRLLVLDPGNRAALEFKRQNRNLLEAQKDATPSPKVIQRSLAIQTNQISTAQIVRDGQLLFEAGKIDEAEDKLNQAHTADSGNVAAVQLLQSIKQKRMADIVRDGDLRENAGLQPVEKGWTRDWKSDEFVVKTNTFARSAVVSAPASGSVPALKDVPMVGALFRNQATPPPTATQPAQATVSLDADGRNLVIQADDATFEQISNIVSKLDVNKGSFAGTGNIRLTDALASTNRFYTGYTRDDIGGLTDLYGRSNVFTEQQPGSIYSVGESVRAQSSSGPTISWTHDQSAADPKQTNFLFMYDYGASNPEVQRLLKLKAESDKIDVSKRLAQNQANANKGTALPTVGAVLGIMTEDGWRQTVADISEGKLPLNLAMNNDYIAKQQELENLKKTRQALAGRTFQENVDKAMPKTTMVEIIQHAEAAPISGPTFGERISGMLGGKVERKASIRLEHDVTDVVGVSGTRPVGGIYDPYLVQTEFEAMQSEPVLDKVIEQLKLDETWAKKSGATGKLDMPKTRQLLRESLDLKARPNSSLLDIGVKSDKPEEAALIANKVAEVYSDLRKQQRAELTQGGIQAFTSELAAQDQKIAQATAELAQMKTVAQGKAAAEAAISHPRESDEALTIKKTASPPLEPQPEVLTSTNAFSTFSLNVSDVSFKLAAASLEKGVMPDPGSIRSEEFINAFDYRDPEPGPGAPLAFAWERVRYPFAHNRDLVRFAVQTAAAGRVPGRPLNLVLLLDNSGSMERADRVAIIHEALRVLATQLQTQDTLSVVTFARTARLWVDGVSGNQAANVAEQVSGLTPEGGTNLEEAMRLAYETARRHYLAGGVNRVVLLTDGAANLGNVDPAALKTNVETNRQQGIALDCFGIGWEGYNDDLLEVLSRNGDGRYGFINTPEEAATGFAAQLAGALHVAAADVKVQIEFNPKRVTTYRQIGYAKHQLTKEQFRDNTVDAAEIGAAEEGNALYTVEINPAGEGPIGTVRVRSRVPGTQDFQEHAWTLPYTGNAAPLEQGTAPMRLAATASAFSEWLGQSPFAAEVTPDQLLGYLRNVPETYGADARPKKLEWMIRQAKSLTGK